MSLLESFLGNAAGAGANILGDQMKQQAAEEQAKRMAQFQEELAVKRAKTITELKRAMDLQAGKEISAESDRIGKERIDKKVKSTMEADPELNGMQPGDQEALDAATPKQLKDVGLMETMSRSAKLDDQATAAMGLGYDDKAKAIRDQQNVEIQRDNNERRIDVDEKRSAAAAAETARKAEKDASDREVQDKRNDIAEKRANALMAKIAGGNGGKDDTKEWMSIINEQRKGVATELAALRADKKMALEGEFDPAKRKEIETRFDAAAKPIAAKIESIDDKVEAVTNRLLDKTGAPKIEKKEPKKEDKFVVGKKYKDASGNVKTYGGNGVWN